MEQPVSPWEACLSSHGVTKFDPQGCGLSPVSISSEVLTFPLSLKLYADYSLL